MMRTGNSHAGRVNLTKYVKLRGAASEKWRFCPVVRTGNGRIRPDYVLIDGRPELHQEGAYYIEWYRDGRRYRESVGKNPSEAFAAAERKAQVLRNQALGIEIVGSATFFNANPAPADSFTSAFTRSQLRSLSCAFNAPTAMRRDERESKPRISSSVMEVQHAHTYCVRYVCFLYSR